MTRKTSKLGATVVLGLMLLHTAVGDALATSGGYSSRFVIFGAIDKPTMFTLKDLQALPPTTQNVYFNTGAGPVNSSWTGVLLWDLLQKVGIKTDSSVKNDIMRRVIVVIATDGYVVTTTGGELSPQFGGNQVLVAYEQDGKLLGQDSGFARLVFPGDKSGGRAISWIKSITVH
jgi:DMSO/TMAO reductase YedYZ molybdopterin-dependent catalytic subunit